MGFKDFLLNKKKELIDQYIRGKVVSEQIRAEKLRKHHQKIVDMKPGAKKAIVEGLNLHKSVWDVAHDEWLRRKQVRDEKYNK